MRMQRCTYPVKQGRKDMSKADTSFWRSGTALKIERMIPDDFFSKLNTCAQHILFIVPIK
jgi:hypothetical protein